MRRSFLLNLKIFINHRLAKNERFSKHENSPSCSTPLFLIVGISRDQLLLFISGDRKVRREAIGPILSAYQVDNKEASCSCTFCDGTQGGLSPEGFGCIAEAA